MATAARQSIPARELEKRIKELEKQGDAPPAREEAERLRRELTALRGGSNSKPAAHDPWERVLLARHPQRPYTLDLIELLFADFTELHGDRRFGDDGAMLCGLARFEGRPIAVVGQQKGRDTKQKLHHNFGMPNPEGYRKALRVMQLAAKFNLPIVTLVDTPGAYPGIGAEERGQAEAIAYNLREIPKLRVPIVVVIHGEGGSGGALAIAVGDKVLMLENAVYSVISPESCSSILWRDWEHKQEAARILGLTAERLHALGMVDEIVPEPRQGAHASRDETANLLRPALSKALAELTAIPADDLVRRRHERLRKLATFITRS